MPLPVAKSPCAEPPRYNLEVVAVHNHMLFDQPRMMFLHYYGRNPAAQLAAGFRAALNQLGRHTPSHGGGSKH